MARCWQPGILCLISGILCLVVGVLLTVSGVLFLVFGTLLVVSGVLFSVSGIPFLVSRVLLCVSGILVLASAVATAPLELTTPRRWATKQNETLTSFLYKPDELSFPLSFHFFSFVPFLVSALPFLCLFLFLATTKDFIARQAPYIFPFPGTIPTSIDSMLVRS